MQKKNCAFKQIKKLFFSLLLKVSFLMVQMQIDCRAVIFFSPIFYLSARFTQKIARNVKMDELDFEAQYADELDALESFEGKFRYS